MCLSLKIEAHIKDYQMMQMHNQEAHPQRGGPFPVLLHIGWDVHRAELSAEHETDGQTILHSVLAVRCNYINGKCVLQILKIKDELIGQLLL